MERSASSSPACKLGILGGTFNPPHRGHLALAGHALRQLGLQRVLLVPACIAPYKSGGEANARDPGPEHRLQMCRLALAGAEAMSVGALEIERGGVSYTVDTLRALHASHPGAELTLIVGTDVAGTLGSWREPAQLLELARVALAARAGTPREPVLETLADLATAAHVSFLEMPAIEVSSSLVRARVQAGEPVEELVGPAVAAYIDRHHLYRAASKAHA